VGIAGKGSGRVNVEVLSVNSPHGGESIGFNDGTGDRDTSIDAESVSNKLATTAGGALTTLSSSLSSSSSASSRAPRSGRGAKRILREAGISLVRTSERVGGVV
jgi:hypothetical protein